MSKKLKIRLNTPLRGHPKDKVLMIECDENLIPKDRFWRNRLKDAVRDNCVDILKKHTRKSNTKKVNNDDNDQAT